jgi:hypothetical protein
VKKGLQRRDHIPIFMKQKRMKYKVGSRILFYRGTRVKTASKDIEIANINTRSFQKVSNYIFSHGR